MSKLGRMHPCQLDYADRRRLLARQVISGRRHNVLKAANAFGRWLDCWREQRLAKTQLEAQHEDYQRTRFRSYGERLDRLHRWGRIVIKTSFWGWVAFLTLKVWIEWR